MFLFLFFSFRIWHESRTSPGEDTFANATKTRSSNCYSSRFKEKLMNRFQRNYATRRRHSEMKRFTGRFVQLLSHLDILYASAPRNVTCVLAEGEVPATFLSGSLRKVA